jgi:DNA-binding beta-propeller fold protein YncE
MRKLLVVFLILALPLPVFAVHDIKFISEIKVAQPLFIAVDEEGKIYTTQKDGTVTVLSGDGQTLFTLGGETEGKEPIIRKPVGIDLYEDKLFVTDDALGKVVIFSKDGEYLDSFGNKGRGPKEFKEPRGIFVYKGVIYVADKGNDRVQVFGPNGVYMGSIGVEGEQDMLLNEPTDVVVDHNGLIYAVDNDDSKVKIFDRNGRFLRSITGITDPYSIALDRDGVYISDAAKYNINKYDFSGERLFTFGSQGKKRAQFTSLAGIAVDREGKVYVADTKRGIVQVFFPEINGSDGWPEKSPPPSAIEWLNEIDTKANKIYSAGKGNLYAVNEKEKSIIVIENKTAVKTLKVPDCRPVSVALDHEGFLWVVDKAKKRLLKLSENGKILLSVGSSGSKPGYFSGPTDISISKNGIIYVADRGNERVQAFNTDGVFLNIIGGGDTTSLMESPLAIALDSDDTLYVLDDDKKTVSLYSHDGRMLMEFGGEGEADWQFDDPVSIAVTDNEVFVLDAGVNKVKVFTNSGKFLREFGSEGNGKGDFRKPSAIAVVDDIVFLISDTGNNRIQAFKTLHTPSAPVNTSAKGAMRSIEIKWDKNPETFVETYRIYRSEDSDRGFTDISTVKTNLYNDCDVLPDKKYYYLISAVAKEGNESLKSEAVSAMPAKYSVSPPSGLKATPKEWSIDLCWEPNNEDFTDYYIIYREDGGELKELGRTASAVFSDISLDADTTYNYRLSAVSTDGVESEKVSIKVTTLVSTKPPLEVDVLQIDDIFSNTYKIYENEGIGRINIVNNTKDYISRLKVSFSIKEFMDFPWETEIDNLSSGESRGLVLKAVFNNKILNVTEDTPVQTEIKVSYYEHQKPKVFSKGHTINIYEKHRMGWNERDRIATFITPKDSTVLEFARSVVTQYGDVSDPLVYAGALFDALGVFGLTYMQDPSNPYQITSGKDDFVDYIQYPRETLKRKSGDCDDLVSLYCATLESIGIPTKLLFYPGHILMMFSTGIEGKEGTDTLDGMLVIRDGYVWAPVEVTLVGSSFMKAWEAGSRSYYEWEGKGLDIMNIRIAWNKFKPASLPISDWRPDCIMRAAIEKKFGDESKTIRKIRVRFISKKHIDTIKADPKNVNALMQLGIIYAQAGEAEEALKVFEKALEHDLKNAALKNNLGNVYFLNEKYMEARQAYEEASALDPKDPYILINLTRCYLKMKMKDEAKEAFRKAQEINPEVSKKHRAISLELMSVI